MQWYSTTRAPREKAALSRSAVAQTHSDIGSPKRGQRHSSVQEEIVRFATEAPRSTAPPPPPLAIGRPRVTVSSSAGVVSWQVPLLHDASQLEHQKRDNLGLHGKTGRGTAHTHACAPRLARRGEAGTLARGPRRRVQLAECARWRQEGGGGASRPSAAAWCAVPPARATDGGNKDGSAHH